MKLLGLIEASEDLVTKEYVDKKTLEMAFNVENTVDQYYVKKVNVGLPNFFSKRHLIDGCNYTWAAIPKDKIKIDVAVDQFYEVQGSEWERIGVVYRSTSGNTRLVLCVADYKKKYWFITDGTVSRKGSLVKSDGPTWGVLTTE